MMYPYDNTEVCEHCDYLIDLTGRKRVHPDSDEPMKSPAKSGCNRYAPFGFCCRDCEITLRKMGFK